MQPVALYAHACHFDDLPSACTGCPGIGTSIGTALLLAIAKSFLDYQHAARKLHTAYMYVRVYTAVPYKLWMIAEGDPESCNPIKQLQVDVPFKLTSRARRALTGNLL